MHLESHLPFAAGIPVSALCALTLMLSSLSSRYMIVESEYSMLLILCILIYVFYYRYAAR
jgi:hypothetical protein